MLALLSYAVHNAHLTTGNVQKAIKEASTEETLSQRITEQECYTEIITTAITDLSEAENPSVSHKDKTDKINGMIEFMQEKGAKPSCMTLTGETVFSDFITAGHDTGTMDSARDIVYTKLPADEFVKQWRNQHDNEIRNRNKSKQRELLEKRWGEYLTPSKDRKDPETSHQSSQWALTLQEHQHIKKNSKSPTMNQMCQKLPQFPDQLSPDTEQMYPRRYWTTFLHSTANQEN